MLNAKSKLIVHFYYIKKDGGEGVPEGEQYSVDQALLWKQDCTEKQL